MKNSRKKLMSLLAGILLVSLAACAPGAPGIPVTGNDQTPTVQVEDVLADTNWTLSSYGPSGAQNDVVQGATATLQFNKNGSIEGSSGCNTFGGYYNLSANNGLSFTNIISTERACTQAGLMDQEQQYFRALHSADKFEVNGDTLSVSYDNGQNVLTFTKTGTGASSTEAAPTSTQAEPVASPTSATAIFVTPIVNPTSTATATGANAAQRIEFAPGATSATVNGELAASESDHYVLQAGAGQTLNVNLAFTQGEAILVIWGADGNVLLTDHAEASSFQGVLPSTQDYYIDVHGRPDGSTAYSMTVSIPTAAAEAKRIEFAPGTFAATVTGKLEASGADQYVVRASAGQAMSVDLKASEGNTILVIWGADGNVLLTDHAEASVFQRELPTTQDYYIMVKGQPGGSTSYSMTVTIPPPATP